MPTNKFNLLKISDLDKFTPVVSLENTSIVRITQKFYPPIYIGKPVHQNL